MWAALNPNTVPELEHTYSVESKPMEGGVSCPFARSEDQSGKPLDLASDMTEWPILTNTVPSEAMAGEVGTPLPGADHRNKPVGYNACKASPAPT